MKKNIGFCGMEKFDNRRKNSVGSSRIRVKWLLNYWPEAEDYVMGGQYDTIVFQKVYWRNMLDEFKGNMIMDLCDPDWLEGKPVFEFIDKVDAVTTSTEPLAEYIRKMRPKKLVQCVPDRIYIPEHKPVKKVHKGRMQKVVWFGYGQNVQYITRTFDELIQKGLELIVISNEPYNPPLAYKNLQVTNVAYSYPGIHAELVKADAVLMPDPIGDERGKYKSNNKTLQSWAVGMPVINLPDDMDRFMDAKERQKESEKRLAEIKNKHDVQLSVKEMKAIIKEIEKRKLKNK